MVATAWSRCVVPAKGNASIVVMGNSLPVGFFGWFAVLDSFRAFGVITQMLLFAGNRVFPWTVYKLFE